jgi:hypothetical protein
MENTVMAMLRACLLPDSAIARTLDIEVEGTEFVDAPYPRALAFTMRHGPAEEIVHNGTDYEVQAVGPTYWTLEVICPGPLGVYLRSTEPIPGAAPAFGSEAGAAAITGLLAGVAQQRAGRRRY